MPSSEPRFVRVSRRAFLTRTAVIGGLVVAPGLACATNDADVFASASSSTTTTAASGSSAASTGSTTADPDPTTGATARSSTSTTTSPPTSGDSTFPDGGELVVDFTFAASGGGRVNNPYVAVWVEDADGNLVDTIAVWFESGKGTKWLPDLRRWYSASDGGDDLSMSGATRVAGSYTVTWDGTDLDGSPVPSGNYVLFIEAAREHGPYEVVSGELAIGDEPFSIDLEPSGELTAASAELVV
jgi:hypothetical protein